jgi:predicted enzyme related to lactoylglutathione lyase
MANEIELLVNVDVPDLEAATKFYTEAFGFRVGRRLGTGAIELLGAAVPLYLLVKAAGTRATEAATGRGGSGAAGAGAQRSYERHWTPVHIDLAVADVAAARARALAAGATAEGEISEHAWGRMALLADPFGHGVCLLQWTGRGYDAIASPP